jgi:hypothetical protein
MKVVKSKKDQNKLPFAFCQLTQSFERMYFHCFNGLQIKFHNCKILHQNYFGLFKKLKGKLLRYGELIIDFW